MERNEVREWLQHQIAEEAGILFDNISCDEDFESFKL
jgi:hypothetical protein